MLYEQELKTFVEGTTNFFEVAAQQPASIGSPYLMEGSPAVHEYTGVINISGKREGVVYFTAPKAMLTVLLMKMQENDFSHETMKDLVGEVANTISGKARSALLHHPDQLAQSLRQADRVAHLSRRRPRRESPPHGDTGLAKPRAVRRVVRAPRSNCDGCTVVTLRFRA